MDLRSELVKYGKTRWLDVGNGGRFDPGFEYLDILPDASVSKEIQQKYHRASIVDLSDGTIESLGTFDLVRLQHTLEHFDFEDGLQALANCARLLREGGYLLIAVPDLEIHIQHYLHDSYKDWQGFQSWATRRIPIDAPASAYFSVFAHSMTFEPHFWCYDYEGLVYQVRRSGKFREVRRLELSDHLASVPFTHNRPEEDVCLLAKRA
jgi:predicted SAM-dependent methyltransferase